MYPKLIRIGVIGLEPGRWHIESYLSIPDVKVYAISDPDEDKLKKMTIRYGIPRVFNDYRELCRCPDIDAVSVCLPEALRAESVICCIENGKHVICESPISHSLPEAEKVLEAAEKFPDVKVMMATKLRFNVDAFRAKKAIDSHRIGKIYYGFANSLKRVNNNRVIDRRMSENGTGLLDLIWWLMGCQDPRESFAETCVHVGNSSFTNIVTGIVRFEDDSSIMIQDISTNTLEREKVEVQIFGTDGAIMLWPFQMYRKNGGCQDIQVSSEGLFRHFINCITNDLQPMPSISQGVRFLRLLDAIYRSANKRLHPQ